MATKSEYTASLQKPEDKVTSGSSKKGLKRKRIISIIFAVGILVLIGGGMLSARGEQSRAYQSYLNDSTTIDFGSLGYEDTFTRWNENDIGNDVNTLLSGGKIYSREGLTVMPQDGTYIVAQDGKVIKNFGCEISYINVYNDTIIYRDDDTRQICSYSIAGNNSSVISKDNCGEVFVTNGWVYYISYTDNSSIARINPEGTEKSLVVETPVASFLVCGDSVVYLTNNQYLCRHFISTGSTTSIVSNVERFFINGDFIIESGDLIFTCSTNGRKAEELHQATHAGMGLVGASHNEVFYQEHGRLYSITEGSIIEICSNEYDLYFSVIRSAEKYLVIAYKGKTNVASVPHLLELVIQ